MTTAAPFRGTEYQSRLERVQRRLRGTGLDGLLLTGMPDFEYLTGFQARVTWTSYSRILAVVVPESGTPSLLVPGFLEAEARSASGMTVRTYGRIDQPPIAELASLVGDVIGRTATLGAELVGETRPGMAPEDLRQLTLALPQLHLRDGAALMHAVRMRKSADEIERLRRACAANTHAFRRVFQGDLAGMTERDVAADLVREALQAGREWDGWTMPGWVAITSGPGNYDRFLGHPRPRVLEPGDMVWADLGVTVDGYWSDFCRAAVVGGPTRAQVEHQEQILDATAVGVASARPGARARDIAAAVASRMEAHRLPTFGFGRVGHGIGLTATELPHVATYDDTVLEAGMVITVEPASVGPDGLYCAEQVVVVGDPPLVLSLAPGELASV